MNSNHYQLFTILIGFRTASPSLCEQSELQCFAPGFRQMFRSLAERKLRRWLSEFVFLPLSLAGVSASLVEKTETNTIR